MFEQNLSITVDISKDDMKNNNKYIVRLLADLYYPDGSRDKFVYNSTLIDGDAPVDSDSNLILFVVLYLVIVCAAIMGAVKCCNISLRDPIYNVHIKNNFFDLQLHILFYFVNP